MNILIILIVICLIFSFIRTIVNNKRQILFNKMNMIYDKMEVYVYEHSLHNKKETISYILPFKTFVVNPGFADIEILINSMIRMPKSVLESRRKHFKEISATVPDDLKKMALEFEKLLERAIKLSSWRMEFVLYFIKIFSIAIIKSIVNRSFNALKSIFLISFKEIYKNENILIPNASKLKLAC